MPTSVHLPQALLADVDRRAKALRISRNQLVIRALEREVAGGNGWSPGFFDQLRAFDPEVAKGADELLEVIEKGKRSKRPLKL